MTFALTMSSSDLLLLLPEILAHVLVMSHPDH